jgi:CreA protein
VTLPGGPAHATIVVMLPRRIVSMKTLAAALVAPCSTAPHRAGWRPAVASLAAGILVLATAGCVKAEPVGEVDTAFKLIGPDHKIVVEAYDDPRVTGVTCYVSRAKTGGIKGAFGLAEDKAEASIACRQVGPISFTQPLPKQEEVFSERMSILFKKLRIVRMVDAKRNALVYLTYSDRVIDGSPQNSVTAVPVDRGTPIPLK